MMRPVDCQTFEFWCEDLNSPRVDAALREQLQSHRAQCPRCSDFAIRSEHQRRALHGLPVRQVPMNLAVNLRVMASKELARRSTRVNLATRMDIWQGTASRQPVASAGDSDGGGHRFGLLPICRVDAHIRPANARFGRCADGVVPIGRSVRLVAVRR